MNTHLNKITEKFEDMTFQKRIFGGINEKDVWKKLYELQELYETLFEEEKKLLNIQLQLKDEQIKELKDENRKLKRAELKRNTE